MKIHVSDRELFWDDLGDWLNFWTFKFRPRCKIGDELLFMVDSRPLARARVSGVEPPGIPWQEGDAELFNQWKVYWYQRTFQALEPPDGPRLSIVQGPEIKKPARPPRVIKTSELREFVYCPREWKLKRGGTAPPPVAKQIKEEKVQRGDRFHLEHGKAVVKARQQPEKRRPLEKMGWALMVLGVLWWVFSY